MQFLTFHASSSTVLLLYMAIIVDIINLSVLHLFQGIASEEWDFWSYVLPEA